MHGLRQPIRQRPRKRYGAASEWQTERKTRRIVVLAGDGIGPEIVASARQVLDRIGTFSYDEQLIGGISIDETGAR